MPNRNNGFDQIIEYCQHLGGVMAIADSAYKAESMLESVNEAGNGCGAAILVDTGIMRKNQGTRTFSLNNQ